MRIESHHSLGLERSMNMQIRVTTFEEHLRTCQTIDSMDDDRRKKAFDIDKWLYDMTTYFSKVRKEILKLDNIDEIKKRVDKLDKMEDDFFDKYKESRESNKASELHYEDLDDEIREWLLKYAIGLREKLRIENSAIEKRLIDENFKKKTG